jgi:hypothetical protein
VEASETDWGRWGMRHGSTGRQSGGGHRGWGSTLWGTGGSEAEWGGWMGMTTQGGNGATSIRALERDERIGSLGERRVRE